MINKDMKKPTIKFGNKNERGKLAVVSLFLLSSIAAGYVGGYFGSRSISTESASTQVAKQVIDNESSLITQIARDVGPSVVSINVVSQGSQQTIFGSRKVQQESAGTGVIIDKSGIIITNRHVVPKQTESVSVTLSDGTEFKDVEVIGRTNSNDTLDIAFLKIKDTKGKDLKAAKIGDSSKVEVGARVVAIGNALGQFQNTVTSGIISGFGRDIEAGDESTSESLQNLFQTDAAINQGNSGGPLVNMDGEVIGINTAVAGSAEAIGFAIPVSDIKGLITSVLKDGKLLRPYIGVKYVTLTDNYAYQYNLNTKRGAYIAPVTEGDGKSIISGSPAEKAGLKEKDIVTKVDGTDIDDKNSLISLVNRKAVGDKVQLAIVRDGKTQTVDVTLEAIPQN
ncbi:MAG: trypsin-like peptidase domain-containing protein [Patescibacteria group bacterium]